MRTCANCTAENPDLARFCHACGAALASLPKTESRKLVSVVFCDLVDSTQMGSGLDAESLRTIIGLYYDAMRAAIERHGGTVEKFIGDAVVAVFGIPVVHEDDAVRAVRAAIEMRDALEPLNKELEARWGVRLRTRTGVNSGEVIATDGAGGQSFMTGGPVVLAARLEQAAGPEGILLGEETLSLVRDAVSTEAVGPLRLKGIGEEITAHRLLGVIPGAAGHARHLDSPLVDREREFALLRDTFQRMLAGRQCQMVTVLGAAGVGKSRLVDEFLLSTAEEATAYRGRCLAYGEGITFWPVIDVVNHAAGLTDEDTADQARAKISELLSDMPDAVIATQRIAQAIGIDDTLAVPEETFWAIRMLFESLARRRPILLVFDDIQWGEPTFLELIEHIADWSRDSPIMLLCLARPDLLELHRSWGGGKLNATSILLEPLSGEESDVLVRNLLGAAELEQHVRERIVDAAGGNPLFVEEILSMLIDDGLLVREGERWLSSGDLDTVAIPPTIAAILAARLDRLSPDERMVIARAAVVGKDFSISALAALLPSELAVDIDKRLSALVRKELLRSSRSIAAEGGRYRFRHILVRDAAYESLPKLLRVELHERFAHWLAERAGNRPEEYEEIIGSHFEQAHRYLGELGPTDDRARDLAAEAGVRLAASGRRAYARGDMPATVNLLQRAAKLLPPDQASRGDFMPELADSLAQRGHGAEVAAVYEELLRFAVRSGDRPLETMARLEAHYLRFLADPSESAVAELRGEAEQAIRVHEESGHLGRLATAMVYLALTHWYTGDIDEMLGASERAVELAGIAQDARALLWAMSSVGTALLLGPTSCDETLARMEKLEGTFPEPRVVHASIELDIARTLGMLRRFEEAGAHARAARKVLKDLGQEGWLAETALTIGTIATWSGDMEVGERETRAGYFFFHNSRDESNASLAARDLARVLVARENIEEAGALAEEVLATAGGYDLEPQIEGRSILAVVRARQGRHEEADRLSLDAISLGASTHFLNLQAEVFADRAQVLSAASRTTDASDAAAHALERFERKGNLVGIERAHALLDRLAGS